MARFDRYLLSQFLLLFGFFALVLVSIFWINSAVRLFDQLIADGQSAGIVLQYTLLSLPRVIGMILPIAGFAGVVYVTNRLAGDSEMVVLRSSGISPWRLARGGCGGIAAVRRDVRIAYRTGPGAGGGSL